MRKGLVLVVFITILGMVCGCQSEKSSSSLEKISVMLDWTPNTNHTGLCVAQTKGYFKEQGLEVDLLAPSEPGAIQAVATEGTHFGVSYQEEITQARAHGIPVVSIAAMIQHNTSGFASVIEKNIRYPRDFAGKTYGGFGSPVEKQLLSSLMEKDKADPSKVNIIYTGNIDFFTSIKKDIDFMWIYYGWTGIEAELRGIPLNMVYLTDYSKDLDYYTPVLMTSEQKIKQCPALIKRFMKAVSKGYQYAIHHPEESANILLQKYPDLKSELVKKSQHWLSSRYQGDAVQWGHQKKEVWQNYANWMKRYHLLEGDFDADTAFTNQFLLEERK